MGMLMRHIGAIAAIEATAVTVPDGAVMKAIRVIRAILPILPARTAAMVLIPPEVTALILPEATVQDRELPGIRLPKQPIIIM